MQRVRSWWPCPINLEMSLGLTSFNPSLTGTASGVCVTWRPEKDCRHMLTCANVDTVCSQVCYTSGPVCPSAAVSVQ